MLPLTAAGAARASAAANPITRIDAMQSRHLVIAAASFGNIWPEFPFSSRPLLSLIHVT
jgi:hypothetical protein